MGQGERVSWWSVVVGGRLLLLGSPITIDLSLPTRRLYFRDIKNVCFQDIACFTLLHYSYHISLKLLMIFNTKIIC